MLNRRDFLKVLGAGGAIFLTGFTHASSSSLEKVLGPPSSGPLPNDNHLLSKVVYVDTPSPAFGMYCQLTSDGYFVTNDHTVKHLFQEIPREKLFFYDPVSHIVTHGKMLLHRPFDDLALGKLDASHAIPDRRLSSYTPEGIPVFRARFKEHSMLEAEAYRVIKQGKAPHDIETFRPQLARYMANKRIHLLDTYQFYINSVAETGQSGDAVLDEHGNLIGLASALSREESGEETTLCISNRQIKDIIVDYLNR